MGMEHRWNVRRAMSIGVVVHGLGERPLIGRITDIGLGGARLSLPMQVFRNSILELSFSPSPDLFPHSVRVQAMVVWADVAGAGLMFCHLDADTLRLLRPAVMSARAVPLPPPTRPEQPSSPERPARYA